MKKIVLLILSLLITSMMIVGFEDKDTQAPMIPNSEYEKLVITDVNYDKGRRVISFKTENKSETTVTTGLWYSIEKYDSKDNWVKTNLTDNLVVIEIAFLIEPNKILDEKIDMSQIAELEDGYYRIVKQYYTDTSTINEYIQFEVNDGDFLNLNSYNKIDK